MKNLKKIFAVLTIVFIASCSKNDDTPTPEPNPVAISSMSPTTGAKNTAVVLTGTGFSNNAASNIVTLNGKPCAVNSATATQLNITIPPAAGTGNIIVTVASNSAQSTTFSFIDTVVVSTVAGSGPGFANGIGAAAQFDLPFGVAIDANGNLYVTDTFNEKIRKITPAGAVSTFAGSTAGFADGSVANAQFDRPNGITVDNNGNVYVADTSNNKIRKITPAGSVTTLAGSTFGFADGIGSAVQFRSPSGCVIDVSGNLYVTDKSNQKIRKISPTGVVTTLAGSTFGFADGIGTTAQFKSPNGIAIDASGNLYVADSSNHKIRKISPIGIVTTLAGSTQGFSNGVGSGAQFSFPMGITVDTNGNLFVIDNGNNKIRKITPSGVVTTIAGSTNDFADGTGSNAMFNSPTGITIDNNGNLYVADQSNNKIRKIAID
jgi:sugar lactone lactonase YvrE